MRIVNRFLYYIHKNQGGGSMVMINGQTLYRGDKICSYIAFFSYTELMKSLLYIFIYIYAIIFFDKTEYLSERQFHVKKTSLSTRMLPTSRNICWLIHWLHQSDGLGSISPLRYICALLWHCSVFYLTINNCINHIISSTMAGHLELSTATPKPAAPPTQILCSRGSQTYPRKSCSVT